MKKGYIYHVVPFIFNTLFLFVFIAYFVVTADIPINVSMSEYYFVIGLNFASSIAYLFYMIISKNRLSITNVFTILTFMLWYKFSGAGTLLTDEAINYGNVTIIMQSSITISLATISTLLIIVFIANSMKTIKHRTEREGFKRTS